MVRGHSCFVLLSCLALALRGGAGERGSLTRGKSTQKQARGKFFASVILPSLLDFGQYAEKSR